MAGRSCRLIIQMPIPTANGKCIANFSGPNASEFQCWRAGGRIVLAQLFPDGSYEVKP
jgi:hypothetical protein